MVCILASGIGLSTYAAAAPLPTPQVQTKQLVQASIPSLALDWPTFGQSAVGAAGYGVLATNGEQTPLATASIAKVMTALAVLERKPLKPGEQGPIITLTDADVAIYDNQVSQGGSVVYVVAGEELTEYQALQALLLPSANNIADTLAVWAFGSVDAYLEYANNFAATRGWDATHFADASGLDAATASSAHDVTELGLLAMQQPVIAEIAAQKSAEIPVAGTIYNVNTLLGTEGIIGLKTGNNDADPGALLFAAKKTIDGNVVTLVGVVMGAQSLPQALSVVPSLVRSSMDGFSTVNIITKGTNIGSVATPWQGTQQLTVTKDLSMFVWHGDKLTSGLRVGDVTAGATAGTTVGSVRASLARGTTKSVPVQLSGAISKPPFSWRVRNVLKIN